MESALRERLAPSELHHQPGHDPRGLFGEGASGVGSPVEDRQSEPAVSVFGCGPGWNGSGLGGEDRDMDRQTLRDWVHPFNASGPEGLIDSWTEGPKPRLSAEQLAQFAQIVDAGPDREKDGVVRWRRIELKRVIAEKFGVDFHPRYVGKLLRKLGFSHMSARPCPPAQDERIVEAFKNVWPAPSARGFVRIGS
jgi:transposase